MGQRTVESVESAAWRARRLFRALRRGLFAAVYDRCTAGAEASLAPLRGRVVGRASGAVLEIGAGTGANLPYYPREAQLTVFEPNPAMAVRLQRKASARGQRVQVDVAEAGRLPYSDAAFDAVVATFVLCSVTDQAAVLAEIRRVLRPGGEFHFLEHVAATDPRVRRWQQRLNPLQRLFADGCELDRDTASALHAAGFASTHLEEVDVPDLPELTRHLIVGVAIA
jgi:ubiquinone/menaquinone biosynthesis C-methylase UbiE